MRTGLLAAMFALGACATLSPEARVRTSLIEAGLSPRMAQCMATNMVDDLSLLQLRRVESLSSLRGQDVGAMPIDRFLYRLRAVEDPEIFLTTSRAALTCTIRDAL